MTTTTQGIIPAAYIGVTGERYRVRVPVKSIWLNRAEGPVGLCREWTFEDWHGAERQLLLNCTTAPTTGGYDKHDFRITWADGAEYRGRYDLTGERAWKDLRGQVRNYLLWVAWDERAAKMYDRETQERAANMLHDYDIGQSSPTPAPADWPVVRDYRAQPVKDGEASLDRVIYGLA